MRIPRVGLRLVVGGLLLIFGVQWLGKAVLRTSGLQALHDEGAIYAAELAAARAAPAGRRGMVADLVLLHAVVQGCRARRPRGRLHCGHVRGQSTQHPPGCGRALVAVLGAQDDQLHVAVVGLDLGSHVEGLRVPRRRVRPTRSTRAPWPARRRGLEHPFARWVTATNYERYPDGRGEEGAIATYRPVCRFPKIPRRGGAIACGIRFADTMMRKMPETTVTGRWRVGDSLWVAVWMAALVRAPTRLPRRADLTAEAGLGLRQRSGRRPRVGGW